MTSLPNLIDAGSRNVPASSQAVAEAMACLDRFTHAFNDCNADAMDAELHFPHVMLAGSEVRVWNQPGQHPSDLFPSLRKIGWRETRYESRDPLLATLDKVHFLVTYTRRRSDASILSEHTNLWIVARVNGRWGISCRSY